MIDQKLFCEREREEKSLSGPYLRRGGKIDSVLDRGTTESRSDWLGSAKKQVASPHQSRENRVANLRTLYRTISVHLDGQNNDQFANRMGD